MRKDKGLNGDLDRLPTLVWLMFLKFVDDMEVISSEEAVFAGTAHRDLIEHPYRWRDWAGSSEGPTGDDLLAFLSAEQAPLPDGTTGPGLFHYLRALDGVTDDDRAAVVANIFRGLSNHLTSGYLLRDVVAQVDQIAFQDSEATHTFSVLYETMLRELRDAAGDSGEFYTPRPLVQAMVDALDPRLGETVLDPACGTGGFLVEAFEHVRAQCVSATDVALLQTATVQGGEAKQLPFMLAEMNLLLHGVDRPNIDPLNSLRFPLRELGPDDRVDVILTNPPFGGAEEAGILGNFPEDMRTTETALLFLQLIMRRMNREPGRGRAAVVVPNTTLFSPGVGGRIRRHLVEHYRLRAVLRLAKGVFEPYTDIETNVLFFEAGPVPDKVLFYRATPPLPRRVYRKTKPLERTELDEFLALYRAHSDDSAAAWFVRTTDLLGDPEVSLDQHNPKDERVGAPDAPAVLEHLRTSLATAQLHLEAASQLTQQVSDLVGGQESWHRVRLGDVLSRSRQAITLEDDEEYTRLTIRVRGRGVSVRDTVPGRDIGTKRQFVLAAGQFVLSKIDARNGAFGLVPGEADGAIITGNFWAYDVDREQVRPELLTYLTRSDDFVRFCALASTGATNRRYLQEPRFLEQTVLVPTALADQDALCDLLRAVEDGAADLHGELHDVASQAPSLFQGVLHSCFGLLPTP
jgi:type I restriction enzyme M protein